jgi:hypothetical protein
MSRSVRAHAFAAAFALVLDSSRAARAAGGAEPIRVDFRAEPGCAGGAEFLRGVLSRTARVRSAVGGEPALTFHVTISSTSDGKLSGDFSITEPGVEERASDKRSIVGESCHEVFDALTLFAALSVDPEALVANPGANAVLPAAPAPGEAPPQPAPLRFSKTTAPEPATPASRPFQAAVGCGVGVTNADTGSSLLLVEPFAEARFAHADTRVSVAPTVRLGFSSLSADTERTLDGRAHLHWTTLRLDGCPVQLELFRSLVARPCLALSGGSLLASGESIAHPESHTLGWWAVGALFRLEWSASHWLSFEASAALDAPMRRDAFYFEPSVPVYQAPSVLGRGELGFGLHFL